MSYKPHQRFKPTDEPALLVQKLNRMQTELARAIPKTGSGTTINQVSTGGIGSSSSTGTDDDARVLIWMGW